MATRYLRAVASRNRFSDRYATELAEAVLESRLFRLALDVLDCEKHTYSRATELASLVLEVCGVPIPSDGSTSDATSVGDGTGTTARAPKGEP